MVEQDPGRTCDPMAYAGAGFLERIMIPWGIHTGEICS